MATLPGVAAVRLEQKGRGRALARVWSESDALVLAYMDVDLSTDLDASGPRRPADVTGTPTSRSGPGWHRASRVVRGARREVISRGYNLMLRATLGARFTRRPVRLQGDPGRVARELLPLVEDTTWFFDTELLVLAERSGLRIHEVPVDWDDDPDSRVALARRRATTSAASGGSAPPSPGVVSRSTRSPSGSAGDRRRPPARWEASWRCSRSSGSSRPSLHLGGFVVLRQGMEASSANAIALLVAAVVNTWANRRWTFRVRGRSGVWRQQVQGLLVLALTLAMTTAGLDLLHAGMPQAATWVETGVVAVTTAVATAVKFLAMKIWVFAPTSLRAPTTREAAGQRSSRRATPEDAAPAVTTAEVTRGRRSRSAR